MAKKSSAITNLPPALAGQLRQLGENLAIARERRRQTVRQWAERLGVTPATALRMEAGDPSVSIGIYATALWLMGRAAEIPALAAPAHDQGALEVEVRSTRAGRVRKRASLAGTVDKARGAQAPQQPPEAPDERR
jgi:hypothetical protein